MEDKEFLEHLKDVGFTPSFHCKEQYDIEYYLEQYDNESTKEIRDKILELEERKRNLRRTPGYDYYNDSKEVDNIDNEICLLQDKVLATILKSAGEYEEVEVNGGHEGSGEDYHIVLYFKEYNKYVRSDGYYYSYDGVSNLSDWYIVVPQQKIITVYELEWEH
jgi:hypothetical protein